MIKEMNLEGYVEDLPDDKEARLERINMLLEDVKDEFYPFEESAVNLLVYEKAKLVYPKINPSFLSMGSKWTFKDRDSGHNLPRFAIQKMGELTMDLSVGKPLHHDGVGGFGFRMIQPSDLPGEMDIYLLNSLNLLPENQDNYKIFRHGLYHHNGWIWGLRLYPNNNLPKDERKEVNKYFKELIKNNPIFPTDRNQERVYSSSFQSIIPSNTREKLSEAEEIFGDKLYVIYEAKAWRANGSPKYHYDGDPLVIGIAKDECFLIDEFDATPLEHFVASEFKE